MSEARYHHKLSNWCSLIPPMLQAPRDYAVVHMKRRKFVATNNQPADNYTPNARRANYPTGGRLCKQQATLIALLVLVRHFVNRGRCGDYSFRKVSHSHYCREPIVLHAFALRVEVCNA